MNGLGIDPVAESVYRRMLSHPDDGVAELAAGLDVPESRVREALDLLNEMALVRSSNRAGGRLHAVNPQLGMEILLSHQQADLARRQQRLEESRAVAVELIAEFSGSGNAAPEDSGLTVIWGLEQIRDNLRMINEQVREEFLTFAPGGSQTAENMKAGQPLNRRLLERGVRMRTVYLDSLTNDPDSVAHAKHLVELGAQVRTAPTLPTRMIVCDRSVAVVAADNEDTGKGAVLIRAPGLVTALCTLFDAVWREARELAPTQSKDPDDDMTPQQAEALRLLAEGHTDEVIARRLGVSPRTARRFASEIMVRLGARSRFQAGVNAVRQDRLPAE
ncbi:MULTISPECIES: LuxR family transcriptional regulator [unclassified Nocardiopsis]|uniref:helix-turn-helix transcriptional regulator n=1 Tax=unclassified Nocardiopsis TaxID=2649073 RepID=UPI001F5B2A2C|nr:LuxR family transcriptional regulator [Nocardiopsis sp. TSRI0078]